MSAHEKLFNEVLNETRDGSLVWVNSSEHRYESFVYQSQSVFRAFETMFSIRGGDFKVVLVEKKYPDADWDFALEKYRPELHFVQEGILVLTIDENTVEVPRFADLVGAVEVSTVGAKQLLGF